MPIDTNDDSPRRACRFVLDLQADDRDGLVSALYGLAHQLAAGELSRGVSGGYSSGYIYELVENGGPTHDEYFSQLDAYLERRRTEGNAGVPPVHVRLAQAMKLHGHGPFVDAVLAECPDAECHECSRIVCPHGEPMHFHHDGCPACAQHDAGVAAPAHQPEQQGNGGGNG